MTEPLRYGQRRVSRMLAEVNAHRAAVRSGDPDATEATWEKLEQWLDLSMLSLLVTTKGDEGMPIKMRGEVETPPVRITVGDTEYEAFHDGHSLADIARWIMKNRGDAEDLHMLLGEALGHG